MKALETALIEVKNAEDSQAAANMFKDSVFEKMQEYGVQDGDTVSMYDFQFDFIL